MPESGVFDRGPAARDQTPRRERRLEQHRARELRFALPALDERDRNLSDARSLAGGDEQHLDEKRVTVRNEAIERHRGQCGAPPAAIAAGAVARAQPGDLTDVDI